MRVLRLIGIGATAVAVVQERIAKTIAAAAGRHRLTLLHGVKAAALHVGRDVLAAILSRRRRRCHREKRQREKRSGRRNGHFQKLFHLLLSVLVSAPEPTWDVGYACAIGARKKQKNSL